MLRYFYFDSDTASRLINRAVKSNMATPWALLQISRSRLLIYAPADGKDAVES